MKQGLATILTLLITAYLSAQSLEEQAYDAFANAKYEEAISLYKKLIKKGAEQEAYLGLVSCEIELGWQKGLNNGDARPHYEKALQHATHLYQLDSQNVKNLLAFGRALQFNYAMENALAQYEKALELDSRHGYTYYHLWTMQPADPNLRLNHEYVEKALGLNPNIYELHMELGDYYKNINNLEKALEAYNRSIEILPTYKALFSAGNLYLFSNDLTKARDYLTRCLELFPEFGWGMAALAGVELSEGQTEKAAQLLQKALQQNPATQQYVNYYRQQFPELNKYDLSATAPMVDQWQGYPDGYREAVSFAEQGYLWEAIRKFEEAYENYSKQEYVESQYLQSMQSWLLHCYREFGLYKEAAECGKRALQLAIENNLTTDQAAIYANLAVIYEEWGDYAQSISMHRESIRLLEKYGQTQNLFAAYANIGIAYRESGNMDSAVYFHEKALQEAESLGEREKVTSWKEVAISYAEQGNLALAEKFILGALEQADQLNNEAADFDVNLAASRVYAKSGKYELANDYWLKISEQFFERYWLHQPQITPAISNAIHIQMNLGHYEFVANNYSILDTNLKFQINNYFPALSDAGKNRFYNTLKKYYEIFNTYVFFHGGMKEGDIQQLHQNQLLAKGILFNTSSKLRRTIASANDPQLKQLFEEWRRSRSLLSKSLTNNAIPDADLMVDSLQKRIDELEVELSLLTNNTIQFEEQYDASNIAAQLEPDEAAVEIIRFRKYDFARESFTDSVYYAALVIKGSEGNKISPVLLTNGNELEGAAIRKYSNSITYDIPDLTSYQAYWGGIQKALGDVNTVYVSPDGVYHKISLNTLLNPETKQYLLEEVNIRMVTSTRDIERKSTRLPQKGDVYIVGYPDFELDQNDAIQKLEKPEFKFDESSFLTVRGDFELTELPGTNEEIQAITAQIAKTKLTTKVYKEGDALEDNVKAMVNPTILHLATHGFFNPSDHKINPLFNSGLYLAGAASKKRPTDLTLDDGILTAYEVMNMYLDDTYLVVLSACETGLGEVENGEGVFGLQRAFLIAGAESVVMSYWKVNDQTTMLLMKAFYEELIETRDKHLAFLKAQQKVKAQYPSPKYWGAFSIVGK